ncbi:FecCD family ABC transporter permease [Phorcysia thermohydrogeniphila]|uniref:Iron complex transport system permease protein n=1 Tax=Phorcysia thermohydrogeniphila TaxID=936138 RepID=A0A4R1GCN2_9BACT|nr:iron ABC transporter permease [Phorcysia thermohydrogeniphila]TCK04553.1 iron complex transport system permease protein [Phorcysia thermohydrogeniphila]
MRKAGIVGLVGALLLSSALLLFWNLPEGGREILLDIRLPELLLALSFGGLLGVGGCIYQGVLRNPLADPYILGVSAGGAFGATLGTVLNGNLEIFALMGGMATILLLLLVSLAFHDSLRVLLFGVGVNAFLSACVFFAYAVIPTLSLQEAIYFTLGFIPPVSIKEAFLLLLLSLALLLLLLPFSREVDALSLGEELSYFSGVQFRKEGVFLLALTSAVVSVFVAKTGIVGFVGIVVPHAVRFLGFRVHRELLPVSFLAGGALLIFSQAIARNVIYPTVLPVGVVASLIGVPAFLYILWRFSLVRS